MPYNPLLDLKKSGAILEGHFLLSSDLHSNGYVQCARYLQHPGLAEQAGHALKERLLEQVPNFKVDVVVSPAVGGLIIGHEVARALGVPAIFSEREQGVMTLRRGFELRSDQTVLIVEDVVTTAKSGLEVLELVEGLGARALALSCIVDRRADRQKSLALPLVSLLPLTITNWTPEECPLCKAGGSPIKPGSRS